MALEPLGKVDNEDHEDGLPQGMDYVKDLDSLEFEHEGIPWIQIIIHSSLNQ
jgi:hypothetical protein